MQWIKDLLTGTLINTFKLSLFLVLVVLLGQPIFWVLLINKEVRLSYRSRPDGFDLHLGEGDTVKPLWEPPPAKPADHGGSRPAP